MIMELVVKAPVLLTLEGGLRKGEKLKDLAVIKNAYVGIKKGRIAKISKARIGGKRKILAKGAVMPGFVDAHTHLIFAGSRADEFSLKIQGRSYQEILENGGGILSTVNATRKAGKKELYLKAFSDLNKMLSHGTTTVEIKSGYGLDFKNEMKILQVAKELNEKHAMDIVATFMGAHTLPGESRKDREGYVRSIIEEMIPAVSEKKLAKYCDVFCDTNAFTLGETRRILECALKHGLRAKMHAEQFSDIGGPQLASEIGATSADHLDWVSDAGIDAMKKGNVIAVLVPTAVYHLMLGKYAPARKMIDKGIAIAIATDYNPGSSPCLSMQEAIAIACRQMKLLPEEAISASTINAAYAIGAQTDAGSIEEGKKADMIILDTMDYRDIAYRFGENHVSIAIKDGVVFNAPKRP